MTNGLTSRARGIAGAKPELKYVGQNKTALATVSVAFKRRVKRGEEWGDETCWVNVQVWGKKAEFFAKDVEKGSHVFIDGYWEQRSWTDQETNKKRSMLQLNVDDYHLIQKPSGAGNGNGNGNTKPTANSAAPPPADDGAAQGNNAPPEGSGPPVNHQIESEAPEGTEEMPF